MSAVTAEAAIAGDRPKAGGYDTTLFKLLILGFLAACTFTARPIFLGVSAQHASLMYFDAPILLILLLQTLMARFTVPGKGPRGVLRVFLPMFLLLIWWGISGLLFAKRTDFFIASYLQFLNGVLVVLIFPWILHRFKLREFAMNAVMGFSLVVDLVAFAQAALDPHRIFEDITSTLSPNHAHIGLYMLVVLTIALNRSLYKGGWWPASVACATFVVMLMSGSRAAQMGSLCILGVYFFRRMSFANFVKLAVGLILIAAVFAYIGKNRQEGLKQGGDFEITKHVKIDKSAGRRLLMWIAAWGVINSSTERFVWGIGFTNFRWEYGKLIKLPFYTNAAHNAYLHIWTETGLFGLCLYLWAYGAIFLFAVSHRKDDPAAGLLAALVVSMLITGMTQETLYPNEAFCNFNVFYAFGCVLLVMHTLEVVERRKAAQDDDSLIPIR